MANITKNTTQIIDHAIEYDYVPKWIDHSTMATEKPPNIITNTVVRRRSLRQSVLVMG